MNKSKSIYLWIIVVAFTAALLIPTIWFYAGLPTPTPTADIIEYNIQETRQNLASLSGTSNFNCQISPKSIDQAYIKLDQAQDKLDAGNLDEAHSLESEASRQYVILLLTSGSCYRREYRNDLAGNGSNSVIIALLLAIICLFAITIFLLFMGIAVFFARTTMFKDMNIQEKISQVETRQNHGIIDYFAAVLDGITTGVLNSLPLLWKSIRPAVIVFIIAVALSILELMISVGYLIFT